MTNYFSFHGTLTALEDFYTSQNGEAEGCSKFMTLENESGEIANFVVSPATYVVDNETLREGDRVTGYYDGDAPMLLIYPPQFEALVMVKESPYLNVTVDYFNRELLSSDGQLQLNISPYTQILLTNGQIFSGIPVNRDLTVIYGPTTRSIPAQTTPYRIIVLCY